METWRVLTGAARAARAARSYPERPCDQCGTSFRPYRIKNNRYCSIQCLKRSVYRRANPRVQKPCATCGNSFMPQVSQKAAYCSIACRQQMRAIRMKTNATARLKRRIAGRTYSRTVVYRLGQLNHKARRRTAEKSGRLTLVQWQNILERFNHSCAYCRRADLPLTKDHVIPLSKGGQHTAENIVPACQPCNSTKGNRLACL
jgi:5-methylcytosine-specific restriction endonuclease McrA